MLKYLLMQEILEEKIKEILRIFSLGEVDFVVEHSESFEHGDYFTNVALIAGNKIGNKPRELAEKIKSNLLEQKIENVEKIEIAGSGFINFFLKPEYFLENLKKILEEGEHYGKGNLFSGRRVMIEYTDPNPFKEFHIGHLMSNAIGEVISRLIEFGGAQVIRANYQGDVGLHVAKAIWGKLRSPELAWGEAYALGAKNYEGSEEEINELNKKIYERSDPGINKLYDQGRTESLAEFEKIYQKLGTKFDNYYFESETGKDGLEIVQKHKDIFEESDGALIFHGEKYNSSLHTRVFVTKEGLPTYEAKELGLNLKKFADFKLDQSIIITGNEVNDYFRVLLKAFELISPEIAQKTTHLSHGMLRLPSGKMSSRAGEVLTAEALLADVEKLARKKMSASTHLSKDEQKEVATQIAVGAIKYSILKQSIGKDIIFDFEKSLSFEGDSGPYLQYTYARACSVLEKGNDVGLGLTVRTVEEGMSDVLRLLERFPNEAHRALLDYAPQRICTYLIELASAFNSYYAKNKIIDAENKEVSECRLALTWAVAVVLKNGLWLLGIKAPERM